MARFKDSTTGTGKAPLDFKLILGSCLEIIGSLKLTGLSGLRWRKDQKASVATKTLADSA
jgi:hypothetical protein